MSALALILTEEGNSGCDAANELINITKELIRQGYSENDLAKIWGGNFLRVMDQVQRVCILPLKSVNKRIVLLYS